MSNFIHVNRWGLIFPATDLLPGIFRGEIYILLEHCLCTLFFVLGVLQVVKFLKNMNMLHKSIEDTDKSVTSDSDDEVTA